MRLTENNLKRLLATVCSLRVRSPIFPNLLGREPIHVAEYDPSNPPVERLEGVFIDWWMIGEGATKVISYLSSFGTSASDRTENPVRIVVI